MKPDPDLRTEPMRAAAVGVESTNTMIRRESMSCLLALDEFRPVSSKVLVDIGAHSHQGTMSSSNEDHYLVVRVGRSQETILSSLPRGDLPSQFEEFAYGMLVADGLGDTGAGGVASRVALSALAHMAIHFGRWNLRVDRHVAEEITARAEWFYRRASEAVVERSRTHPALTGMSTTMTAAYTAGSDLFVAHVGHSRAYLYRQGSLSLLTRDHTLAWNVEKVTGIPASSRPAGDLSHILTETIGGSAEGPLVDVDHLSLLDGDTVLLCTNGLTDVVSEERIAEVLTCRRAPDEQSRLLVDLALRSRTPDNVTAVVAQYEIPKD
jgi:serine/threonine protein phosphatase PrpC